MRIHKATVLGQEYAYRLLTRREFREIQNSCDRDPVLFEELVCEKCVTAYPEDFPGLDDCFAGIPTTLCDIIMLQSGYSADIDSANTSLNTMEVAALEWAKTPESRIISLIVFCMPSLTKDAVEDLDPEDFYYYAAMAQLIARGLYGMDVSGFLDPSQDQEARPKRGMTRNAESSTLSPEEQARFDQLHKQMNSMAGEGGYSSHLI